MKSQRLKVIYQFKSGGRVSRNWALQNYISRLSAIILSLKKSGYKIEGHYEKTESGQDYIYELIEAPRGTILNPRRFEKVMVDGVIKVREV